MISFEFYLKKWQEKTQKPLWFLGFLEPISFSVHNFGCGGRTRTYGLVFSLRRKYCGRFGGSDSPPDCHSLPPHPSSYSPFGLITRTGSWENNLHNLKKKKRTPSGVRFRFGKLHRFRYPIILHNQYHTPRFSSDSFPLYTGYL